MVQIGTPVELFERPQHTFVGHFIGSPGMNVLPCEAKGDRAVFEGHEVMLEGPTHGDGGRTDLGIRPEYVGFGDTGIPAHVTKVADIGRHYVVSAMVGNTALKAVDRTQRARAGLAGLPAIQT